MRIEFKDIIDSEKGKTGFVLGLGPSLRRHLDTLHHFHNDRENYCITSVNNIDRQIPTLKIAHWLLAQPADSSSEFYIPNAYQRYNRDPNTVFYYTDCLDLTPREMVAQLLTGKWCGYDQRHGNGGERCGWKMPNGSDPTCCARIIPGRKTIQEEFRDYTGGELYGAGDTVGLHALSNSVILGCNPIYITGIDLNYEQGYANNELPETKTRTWMGMNSMNRSPAMVARVLEDLKIIRDCAAKIGTKIYCMDNDLKISSIFEYGT